MSKLDKMIELQDEFTDLYHNGLVGLHPHCLHLKDDFFRDTFDTYSVRERPNDTSYPYELSTTHQGTKVIALSDEK